MRSKHGCGRGAMKLRRIKPLLVAVAVAAAQVAAAEPSLESGTVIEAAEQLKPGEYLWAPQVAPEGPVLLIVSLATQRAVIYRNGIPIGISTVSTGRQGHETPTGVFTILQKHVEHYSNLYDNAPMPYMQRLTWGGVALHGGHLPGYPASHGCIRLPNAFARRLFGVTRLGMTVIVTDEATVPRVAPAESLLISTLPAPAEGESPILWAPQRSPSGPVSIVVSAAERRAVVLRNGVVIGSAPVTIDAPITRTSAFVLNRMEGDNPVWLKVGLPGQSADASEPLRGRISVSDAFRQAVESILAVGTTVVVTGDPLSTTGAQNVDLIEGE